MLQNIERIEYRRGPLEKGKQPANLPVKIWHSSQITPEILKSILNEDILNQGGTYGDRSIGSPPEYDHLKIILSDDEVEIEFFNRGISLITTNNEIYRRIHRVLCVLDKHTKDRKKKGRARNPIKQDIIFFSIHTTIVPLPNAPNATRIRKYANSRLLSMLTRTRLFF